MTLKAVGDMSIAGNTTGQIPQADRNPVIGDVKSRAIKLMDLVTIGSIGSNLKEWMYVANEEGAAGATGEGLIKNQIDFEILIGSQKVEKITAYITITDEMLDDVEQIRTLINNKLTVELNKALEQGVFDGSGVSPILNGIDTVATTFAAGVFASTVDSANEVDVLQVASNQIEIADQDMATAILMHPSDVTSLLLTKMSSTDKRYVERLQMIAGTLSFDGIPVVKTTLVTQGEFLMGDFSKASVDFKQGVTIEVGYNADNFVKNYKTIRAEVRAVCYVENNDRTAFVKGVFATAQAALETP
jgi:HK97 family phage major capsid protein